MIAHLSGKILEKSANTVLVDVGGVGYDVTIPLSTFYELGEAGEQVELRIHTHVREDAIQLFGFRTSREKDLYMKLISVQGVGARSGITMLSGMSADEMVSAIRSGNIVKLTSIPGVGRKTAERLLVELRDKVGPLADGAVEGSDEAGSDETDGFTDALSALVNLGYQKAAAEKALKNAQADGVEPNVQKLLRAALQRLAR